MASRVPKREPNTMPDGALACAFGEPWGGLHPLCEAETARGCAQFDADVAAGKYDADGYTPKERAARDRRLKTEGRLF